ncbi:hypothetical protein NUW54_g10736 [Trametes sanguinea]|uniref:Uncharacterized protein n=1 Tax=Trametes sanguinea TaxID=158606 RepID=A0ACC1NUH3_9APHY|nr:hypothetical protein NUW54_g10736 [Trametes sanguinea]
MSIIPNPSMDISHITADPTLASAGEDMLTDVLADPSYVHCQISSVIFRPTIQTYSTLVSEDMPSGDSVANTPLTSPGATMATEPVLALPTELAGSSALDITNDSVPPAVTTGNVHAQMSSDDDEDEDDEDEDDFNGGVEVQGRGDCATAAARMCWEVRERAQPVCPPSVHASRKMGSSSSIGKLCIVSAL